MAKRARAPARSESSYLNHYISVTKNKEYIPICPILNNTQFQADLTTTKDLLDPIYRIQYISEAESYPLYRVYNNQNEIRAYLISKVRQYLYLTNLQELANKIQEDYYLMQVQPINIVAVLLQPKNWNYTVVGVTTIPIFIQVIYDFFALYLTTLEERTQALKQQADFRAQANRFALDSIYQTYINNPDLFWATTEAIALQLSRLVRRVIKLPSNLILAERDQLVINLIKSKTRNSLKNVYIDKLIYIYINKRTCYSY